MRALEHKKLLMLIAPNELRQLILDTAQECGVGGYTFWSATGAGATGIRSGAFASDSNVIIEIILSEQRLNTLLERIQALMDAGYRLKALVFDMAMLPRR